MPGVAVAFGQGARPYMKYFGTKQVVEIDADAIAVERLMALASRFKTDRPSDVTVEPSTDSNEALSEVQDRPN
jgi:hypothetical protein